MNQEDILDIFAEDDDKPIATAAEIYALDYKAADCNGKVGREEVAKDIYYTNIGVYLKSCILSREVVTPIQLIRALHSFGYIEGLLNFKIIENTIVVYAIINRFGTVERELYSRVIHIVFDPEGPPSSSLVDTKSRVVNYVFDKCDISVEESNIHGNLLSIKI